MIGIGRRAGREQQCPLLPETHRQHRDGVGVRRRRFDGGDNFRQRGSATQMVQILDAVATLLQPMIDRQRRTHVEIGGSDDANQFETAAPLTGCVIG